MWILDALNANPDQLWLGHRFPTAAGNGLVYRADFIGTESHGGSPLISGMGFPMEGRKIKSIQPSEVDRKATGKVAQISGTVLWS